MTTHTAKVDIHIEPELKEWLQRHSRREGHHTMSAYVRFLLIRERREQEEKGGEK